MNNYTDLEISVLSLILQKPDLMKNTRLENKYFIKHKKIWIFMNEFYKRFGNFDLTLMMAVSKNKYRMIEYIAWLIDQEASPSLFKVYEQQLIDEYNQTKKNKYVIEKVYELANSLYVGNITLTDFNKNLSDLYKNANEIFK